MFSYNITGILNDISSGFVIIQVSFLLDSSLPSAVRKSFVLIAGFAAAGGKARTQHKTRAVRSQAEKKPE